MSLKRKIALSLVAIFGVYVLVGTIAMLKYYTEDIRWAYIENADTRQVTHPKMMELKDKVMADPSDKEAIAALRELDYNYRISYFSQKVDYEWLSISVVIALGLMIASLRMFYNFAPAPGLWVLEPDYQPGARTKKERKLAMKTLYAAGSIFALVLVVLGLTMSPVLPEAVAQDDGDGKTVAATPTATPEPTPQKSKVFNENWPAFRGPGNIGIATGKGPWPMEWELPAGSDEGKNIAWSVPCTLEGKSSPIVWGDYVFVSGGNATQLNIAAYDRKTGKELWNKKVEKAPATPDFEPYPDTGFAAPTPTTDGIHVYSIWGNGVIAAFDFQGNQVWMKNLGVPDSMYSFSASLICHKGLVLLQLDEGMSEMDEKSRLIAYEGKTGEVKYETPRPVANAWSSPSIIDTGKRTILLTTSMPWIIAYNPEDGAELWRFEGMFGDVGPSPAWNGKYFYITNDGAELFAIKPGGEGNVTDTHKAWSAYDGLPDTSSPVATKDYVLQVAAGGYLTCFKAESDGDEGVLLWEEFLPVSATASPILAGGHWYLATNDGSMFIIKPGEEYNLVKTNTLNMSVEATPAFADNRIYIRAANKLVCIEDPALLKESGDAAEAAE
jgi:hypothetical protein